MPVGEGYKRYLKSAAWAKKREQVFNYYGKKCYACGSRRPPIQVHHLTYERLGHEALRDLRPLCGPCHREVTALHWRIGKRKVSGEVAFSVFMKSKGRNR